MPPASAIHDACFGMGSFFSICTQPTKVAHPPLKMREEAPCTRAPAAQRHSSLAGPTHAPATRDREAGFEDSAAFGARTTCIFPVSAAEQALWQQQNRRSAVGGPRHTLVAPVTTESAGSSCRRPVVTSPHPAPAAHFHDFFGAPSAGLPTRAAVPCGAFCGPALLEARCPYGTEDDARLHEVLELLKCMRSS